MKIVAFLQNMWFRDPERMKKIFVDQFHSDREHFIRTWLFWSCLTGKRLRSIFGEDLCDEIIWEEQSPEIGGKSSASFPADYSHIRRVLTKHQPQIVIAFGVKAKQALCKIKTEDRANWEFLSAPHPAARSPNTVLALYETWTCLNKILSTGNLITGNLPPCSS